MLIVPLEEARPGMTLAAPVAHPQNPNQDLLRSGYTLEPTVLRRMCEMGIPFVYVDFPGLESLDKHLAVHLSPARQAVYRQIRQSITEVQRQTRPAIPYDAYVSNTRALVDTLLTQGQNPIYLDQMSRQGGDAVAHAAAVAHLSLLLGIKLEQYLIDQRSRLPAYRARDVVNLGIAGMLHDIGMGKLPEELQNHAEPDPPEDDKRLADWQSHAQIGYDLIHNGVEASAAAAVYQHHQHYAGGGFPAMICTDGTHRQMAGEKIHVFARIILCANLYDRLSAPARGQPRRTNRQVMRLMHGTYADWCDPQVLRTLQSIAPAYPPGSKVRLSDGTRAVVMDVNPHAPGQPIVRRLDKDNWTLLSKSIDLAVPEAPKIVDDTDDDAESPSHAYAA